MRCAFTVDSGLPFTRIVNVSSFSVAIRLPNHDFFVNSGEDSGVRCTSSVDTKTSGKRETDAPAWVLIVVDSLCIFLLWNRGLPRKLFLMFVKRVFHICPPLAGPPCWLALLPPRCGDAGWTIADCVIGSLSAKRLETIIGPELAR
jgi:hypothetical protein